MTASKQEPQRCWHECVCKEYRAWYLNAVHVDEPCADTLTCEHFCEHDTSQPVPDGEKCCITCINVPCKILDRVPCPRQENPCEDNGCTDIENCDEICQHSRIYSPIQMQEGKKAAVKAERERVVRRFHDAAELGVRELLDALDYEEQSLRGGEQR